MKHQNCKYCGKKLEENEYISCTSCIISFKDIQHELKIIGTSFSKLGNDLSKLYEEIDSRTKANSLKDKPTKLKEVKK